MTLHADILDTRESLKGGFWASVSLHGTLIAIAVAYTLINANTTQIGDANAGGSAVGVEVAKSIPLQHHGMTESGGQRYAIRSSADAGEKSGGAEKNEPPPQDAIPLKMKKVKSRQRSQSERQHFGLTRNSNEISSPARQAPQVSSPFYSAQARIGQRRARREHHARIRCPGYAAQIQALVAQHWHTGDVDPRLQTAPVVIATFDLCATAASATCSCCRPAASRPSNFSVQRAIQDASPFPPIPPGFEKDTIARRIQL